MNDNNSEADKLEARQIELDLTSNQRAFAESLGVDWFSAEALSDVLQGIEQELGQRNIQEMIRWFLLGVYRHSVKGKWERPDDSGLSQDAQYRLSKKLADRDEYKLSLLTVLKDIRCRYTLLKFGKSRNPARRTLSNTTKAYKQAQQLLREEGFLPPVSAKKTGVPNITATAQAVAEGVVGKESDASGQGEQSGEPASEQKSNQASLASERESSAATAVKRRAARRGFQGIRAGEQSDKDTPSLNAVAESPRADTEEDSLTEEEFEELDKALGGSGNSSVQRWTYNTNEERLSLLLGVLAGSAVCVLMLWLIY